MNHSLLPPTEKIEPPEIRTDSPTPQATRAVDMAFWSWLSRFEWIAVLVVGFVAMALHLRFISNVGGLWRDEANSVQLSTLPTLNEVWRSLDFDSFPILFFAILR